MKSLLGAKYSFEAQYISSTKAIKHESKEDYNNGHRNENGKELREYFKDSSFNRMRLKRKINDDVNATFIGVHVR